MPLTISHAAAVLPLRRRPLVFPALVAGSMSPDLIFFLYFLPVRVADRAFTHSLLGTLLFGVPMALALLVLARVVVAPLLALASPTVQPRLVVLLGRPRWSWLWLPSAELGALTHLAWDAFTHRDDPGVRLLPALAAVVPPGIPVYRVLQYGSSVLGLLVLVVATRRWYVRADRQPVPAYLRLSRDRRLAVLGVIAWVGFAAALRYSGTPRGEYARFELARATLTRATIGGITGVALAVLAWALLWHSGLLRRWWER